MDAIYLTLIPLTQDDINLITFALRRLSKETGFADMKGAAEDLTQYIEKENKERNGGQ